MSTLSGLEGRSVVVTGGASGIGRAAVQTLLRNGAHVTIGDTDSDRGESLVADCVAAGFANVSFERTDVTSEPEVARLVAAAVSRFGGLDGGINCAGLPPKGVPLHEMDAVQWERSQAVNLTGMFFSIKHQLRAIIDTGSAGAIVAVSSTAAVGAVPASAEYVAAKAGVNGLMPGAIQTPMMVAANDDNAALGTAIRAIPLRRVGEAAEAAALTVWLASEQSSYVTGAMVPVDGGLSAR
jgi:NAD(P)-dependent dehydrogenase (short-subunit alcohol dehydrogenase family)